MPRLLVPGCTLYSQLILRISSHIHCIPISGEIFEWNNLYSNWLEYSSVTISDQWWPWLARTSTGQITLCWQGQSPLCCLTEGADHPSQQQPTPVISALLYSALPAVSSSSRLD